MQAALSARSCTRFHLKNTHLRAAFSRVRGCAQRAVSNMAAPNAQPIQNGNVPDLNAIKGVLFDIDGTLTCSDPLHFKA
jgi:hypothetical protein